MSGRASPTRDFPFYAGVPVAPTARGWALGLGGLAASLAVLMALHLPEPGLIRITAPMLLFGALTVMSLPLLAGPRGFAVFHRPTLRDIALGLACAALTLTVSFAVGALVLGGAAGAGNPVMAAFGTEGLPQKALFLAAMAPQLLGEELITIVSFLALLTLGCGPLRLSRGRAMAMAWIGSTLLFAAIHLPTYQWRFGQTFATIGTARLCLTLAYVLTKNLWASTVAHVANDWSLLGLQSAALALGAGQTD